MDKKFYEEVLKTALLAFEEDGYANFSIKLLTKCSIGEQKIYSILRDLEVQGFIHNETVNGYYSKYKLNYSGECPDYIFDSILTFGLKSFILRVSKIWSPGDKELTGKAITNILSGKNLDRGSTCMGSNNMYKIKSLTKGKSVFNIISESTSIKLHLGDFDNIKQDENGYKSVRSKSDDDYHCQYCGETNSNNFYSSHITCKKCCNKRQKENKTRDIYRFLYNKAYDGYTPRKYIQGFDITIDDVKNQWEKQNCVDYYTGLEVEDLTRLSIDRLDSSKGYTDDNIVLTDYKINVMKNDLSVEEFKDLISKIHANISNF